QPVAPPGAALQAFEPIRGLREHIVRDVPAFQAPSLGEVGWVHRARGGRDEYVKFDQPGLLWPLGHLATQVTITERKFVDTPTGLVGAYLRQRMFIKIKQPVRDYRGSAAAFPNKGRELPFTLIRFTTLVTPDIEKPPESGPFFPMVGSEAYSFEVI